MTGTIGRDKRGISNALGFILVFAIVITSVGVIYVSGVDKVEELREREQVDNAERGMFIAQQNIRDLYLRGVPGRGVEFRLTDSQLSIGGNTEMTVSVDGTEVYSRTSQTFTYRVNEEQAIVYEMGGIIRTYRDSAVMSEAPPVSFRGLGTSDSRVYMTLVEMRGSDTVGGTTTALAVFRLQSSGLVTYQNDARVTVRIETTPTRAQAWKQYFEEQGLEDTGNTDVSAGVVEYETNNEVDTIVIRRTVVSGQFE